MPGYEKPIQSGHNRPSGSSRVGRRERYPQASRSREPTQHPPSSSRVCDCRVVPSRLVFQSTSRLWPPSLPSLLPGTVSLTARVSRAKSGECDVGSNGAPCEVDYRTDCIMTSRPMPRRWWSRLRRPLAGNNRRSCPRAPCLVSRPTRRTRGRRRRRPRRGPRGRAARNRPSP